jgi:hypothetical protein
MPATHAFSSAKSDGGDATLVKPSDWNADHVGLVDTLSQPTVDTTVRAGYSAVLVGLPLIIDSGRLVTVAAGGVLVLQP